MTRPLLLLLTLSLAFSGCSSFSKSARQQRAYAKYVRNSSQGRVKQQTKFHSTKPQMPVTQPTNNSVLSRESGPQSIPVDN